MGTYSYDEHVEIFGGPPERGEAFISREQADALNEAREFEANELRRLATSPFTVVGALVYDEDELRLEREADDRDAALEAARFNDPVEQDHEQALADLRAEYDKSEYHELYDYDGFDPES